MEMQYFRQYSPALEREMECKVYGSGGRPVLFIPCQGGRFFDFEDFHMADTWSPWINGRHEDWMRYITDEMVPFIHQMVRRRAGQPDGSGVLAFGCSLGATHAANLYFRRPDLFDGLLALSGIYTAEYGFGSYMDDLVYLNSPVHYMANLPEDHPYIPIFNRQRAAICVGQGDWERPETTFQLAELLRRKDIHPWVDIWGRDVVHDWPWWYQQVTYFVPWLLGGELY